MFSLISFPISNQPISNCPRRRPTSSDRTSGSLRVASATTENRFCATLDILGPTQRWLWDGIFLGSQIPYPKSRDFWDFFPKKIPNQKSRDFLGFLGLGFFFEWDPKIPINPKLFPVKDLHFSDFLKRKTKQKIPSSIHQFRYFWT